MSIERSAVRREEPGVDHHDTVLSHHLAAPSDCRVLVVDDDELLRERLAAQLRTAGFEVAVAASGEEALHALNTSPFHMVLTDWEMPRMDGLTLCRHLRETPYDNYIYVLMLTVRGGQQNLLAGLRAGADDYVLKGAPLEELLARIEIGRRITHVEQSLRISNRENRRLAVTDPLTGAYNLRYLMTSLPRELARCRRYQHPLALLSCDIDGFKQVNDRHGHPVGDLVLQTFVSRAMSCLRKESDWLTRTGGDEFVIVLPETNRVGADSVAHKLRRLLASQPALSPAGPVAFMASIGVCTIDPAEISATSSAVDDLLQRADRHLYARKRGEADGIY